MSKDGRFVAWFSLSTNLVLGDTNLNADVFVRDRLLSSTKCVSVDSNGNLGDKTSGLYGIWVSPSGRFVAFESRATNLVPGDTNGVSDVFVHDMLTGKTERESVGSTGAQGNRNSQYPSISADDRYVAFTSDSTNLVSDDTNGSLDVFVHDRQTGETERVSISSTGVQGDGDSYVPAISADGRFVAFESIAGNLVPGDTNNTWDVFVRDLQAGTTERVSVGSGGTEGDSFSWSASISADGRFVAFTSRADNLVSGDTNGSSDVFLRDRLLGTTERVSLASDGAEGNGHSGGGPVSDDGRYVAFTSFATNLVPGDRWPFPRIYVRDRVASTTERVTTGLGGSQPDGFSSSFAMSADGRYVAFESDATNLVPGDTNGASDIFLYDRSATGFTSLCAPGAEGVHACPCSNPPATSASGCDNSSATGGAVLSASGVAYLSVDSLVFTTSGENASALSTLFQGTSAAQPGIVFGQGVRCVAGPLVRLYTKDASGGAVMVPDLAAGDPTVSSRSRSLGIDVRPGSPYDYFVAYRDPVVLGGCPPQSTFNTTQAAQISWWP